MNVSELEKLRKEKNINQIDFCKKIGISTVAYLNAIKRQDFKVSTLEKISKVLGVPVSYFFEDGDKNKEVKELKKEVALLKEELYLRGESFRFAFMQKELLKEIIRQEGLYSIEKYKESYTILFLYEAEIHQIEEAILSIKTEPK